MTILFLFGLENVMRVGLICHSNGEHGKMAKKNGCTDDDIYIDGRYATIHSVHLHSRLDRAHTVITRCYVNTHTSVTHMIQGKMSQVRRG